MLDFEFVAEQLESDGHFEMANALKAHGKNVVDLKAALDFSDQCAKDENAASTGALRDAREWVMRAARDACAAAEAVSSE